MDGILRVYLDGNFVAGRFGWTATIITDRKGKVMFHKRVSVHRGRGRVSLGSGSFLVTGPMFFLRVGYPWYQVPSGGGVGYPWYWVPSEG